MSRYIFLFHVDRCIDQLPPDILQDIYRLNDQIISTLKGKISVKNQLLDASLI